MWTVPHPKFHIEAGRIERNLDVNDVLVGLGNGVYLSLPRNTCVASIMRRASLPM
jgi:sulfur transfer complex TusBCD TusB component (DsrH family)